MRNENQSHAWIRGQSAEKIAESFQAARRCPDRHDRETGACQVVAGRLARLRLRGPDFLFRDLRLALQSGFLSWSGHGGYSTEADNISDVGLWRSILVPRHVEVKMRGRLAASKTTETERKRRDPTSVTWQ